MGISRDGMHKRSHTSAKRVQVRKKRKFELGRQPANTKIGEKRIHTVRVRGGNKKFRALRLNTGNFSWASESVTKKVRIIRVMYNATSNELVRTNTLVKSAIVEVDFTHFRNWYESHYGKKFVAIKQSDKGVLHKQPTTTPQVKSDANKKVEKKDEKQPKVHDPSVLDEHFVKAATGSRVLARITSRPGQSGRADGHLLEGKELDFYIRRLRLKK